MQSGQPKCPRLELSLELTIIALLMNKVAFIVALLLVGAKAGARTFIVSSSADGTSITTLRGAITAANARGGANTIILQQDVHLSFGTLVVTGGELTIRGVHTVNIVASQSYLLSHSILYFQEDARVKLENLVLTGAKGFGGAIWNEGDLRLRSCTISNNFSFAPGAGVYNCHNLSMDRCKVVANATASGFDLLYYFSGFGRFDIVSVNDPGQGGFDGVSGAGIYNLGTMKIEETLIAGNVCGFGGNGSDGFYTSGGDGGDGGNGGGIFNGGELLLRNCVVEHNAAGEGGGGGLNWGGPIGPPYNPPGFPVVCGDGGGGGSGGGIYNSTNGASVILIRTSVAANTSGAGGLSGGPGGVDGADGSGPNIFGDVWFRGWPRLH